MSPFLGLGGGVGWSFGGPRPFPHPTPQLAQPRVASSWSSATMRAAHWLLALVLCVAARSLRPPHPGAGTTGAEVAGGGDVTERGVPGAVGKWIGTCFPGALTSPPGRTPGTPGLGSCRGPRVTLGQAPVRVLASSSPLLG